MRKLLPIAAFLAITFGAGGMASADTACFDWVCDPSTSTCVFDLSCSEADPFIWRKRIDFGDGDIAVVGGTLYYHEYQLPTYAYPTVTLTIYPWSNNAPTTVSCQIVVANYFGPTLPTEGRCTSP